MGVWGPTAPAWYFLLLPRPPVFLARAGGSAFFFLRRSETVKAPQGPLGFSLDGRSRSGIIWARSPRGQKSSCFVFYLNRPPGWGAYSALARRRGGGRGEGASWMRTGLIT